MEKIKEFADKFEKEFLKNKDEWEDKFSSEQSSSNYIEQTILPLANKYEIDPCDITIYSKCKHSDFCPQEDNDDYFIGFTINNEITTTINISKGTIISFLPSTLTQKDLDWAAEYMGKAINFLQ